MYVSTQRINVLPLLPSLWWGRGWTDNKQLKKKKKEEEEEGEGRKEEEIRTKRRGGGRAEAKYGKGGGKEMKGK